MSIPFHVLIPARYQSSRLPGKLLMELCGKTVLERVYHQACAAKPQSIIIATDHPAVAEQALGWGAAVVMTDSLHQSGTDRIAEVVNRYDYPPEAIVVNVQGDEPLIDPALIQQVAQVIANASVPMATLCWPLHQAEQIHNPNVVKVVRDCNHFALYFSRSPIPYQRESTQEAMPTVYRHIGLYAYRAEFLLNMVRHPVCALEQAEGLEQLRVLWAGHKIKVEEACVAPLQDINTLDDLTLARQFLAEVSPPLMTGD